jgi:hypothetical protein
MRTRSARTAPPRRRPSRAHLDDARPVVERVARDEQRLERALGAGDLLAERSTSRRASAASSASSAPASSSAVGELALGALQPARLRHDLRQPRVLAPQLGETLGVARRVRVAEGTLDLVGALHRLAEAVAERAEPDRTSAHARRSAARTRARADAAGAAEHPRRATGDRWTRTAGGRAAWARESIRGGLARPRAARLSQGRHTARPRPSAERGGGPCRSLPVTRRTRPGHPRLTVPCDEGHPWLCTRPPPPRSRASPSSSATSPCSSGSPADERRVFAALVREQRVPRGALIVRQGDPATRCTWCAPAR